MELPLQVTSTAISSYLNTEILFINSEVRFKVFIIKARNLIELMYWNRKGPLKRSHGLWLFLNKQ